MSESPKKAHIRARNKKTQIISKHARSHQDARDAALEEQQALLEQQKEASRAAAVQGEGAEPWTARTEMIRNRLTNKRRKSTDRWNRFAGTGGAGGRGR